MKSHEVVRKACKRMGCKQVAADMKVSTSLVQKWGRPRADGRSEEWNPLDRADLLYRVTEDIGLVKWLCAQAGGFFVANPVVAPLATKAKMEKLDLTQAEAVVLRDEAELLSSLVELVAEKELSPAKVSRLRAVWERCKADVEGLVMRCERGALRLGTVLWPIVWWAVSGDWPEAELALAA